MKPREIRALLLLHGYTLTAAAGELGVSLTAVSLILKGHAKSKRIQEWIAGKIGRDIGEIWPKNAA